jgi:uncharacterized protein YjiS (DUF1127 family)
MTAPGDQTRLARAVGLTTAFSFLLGVLDHQRRRSLQRRDLRRLLESDVHVLRDIGLSREEILNELQDL